MEEIIACHRRESPKVQSGSSNCEAKYDNFRRINAMNRKEAYFTFVRLWYSFLDFKNSVKPQDYVLREKMSLARLRRELNWTLGNLIVV